MGNWGKGILQNDRASSIWEEALQMYEQGYHPATIKERLDQLKNADGEPLIDTNSAYWMGLAVAHYHMDFDDKEVYEVVEMIVRDKIDISSAEIDSVNGQEVHAQRVEFWEALTEKRKELRVLKTSKGKSNLDNLVSREKYGDPRFFDHKWCELHISIQRLGNAQKEEEADSRYAQFFAYQLFKKHLELCELKYSMGEPVAEVKKSYQEALTKLKEYQKFRLHEAFDFERVQQYLVALRLVSLSYLLEIEQSEIETLAAGLGNEGKDLLYESILGQRIKGRVIKKSLLHPDPFKYLAALPQAQAERKVVFLAHFMKQWYKTYRSKFLNPNQRPGQFHFVGYWSFELAAMIKIHGVEDRKIANSPVYPRDLIGKKLFRTWSQNELGQKDTEEFNQLNAAQTPK